MGKITTEKRNRLAASQFALPATRQYPIHDAAHTRAAAARLEQNKRVMKPADYQKARAAIAAAARRFGISSEYLKKQADAPPRPPRRRGLHVRVGLGRNGEHRLEIMHAADPSGTIIRCDALEIPALSVDRAEEAQAFKVKAEEARLAGDAENADRFTADAQRLLDDAIPRPVWIQLAKVGTFKGHPAGPFELTPSTFDEIVQNFLATANRRIPIDFEHASEADPTAGSIPQEGAPAQGWIVQLDNRGLAGLWGLVEWLEPARTYIREGKYKFFSPAIRFGSRDRVTGKPIGARLTSGAITNTPFLDALQPLAAKDAVSPTGVTTTMSTSQIPLGDHHAFMRACRTCLKMDDLASPDEMKDKIGRLRDLCRDAPHADAQVMGVPLGDYMHPLRDLTKMSADSTVGDILDAVQNMIDAALERHVEEYHMSDLDSATPTTITTDDRDVAVQLGEARERLARLTAEKATLAAEKTVVVTERAQLQLQLRDAQSARTVAEARVATLEGEIVTMRAAEATRQETALAALVDTAHATYKDVKKLTDDDREAMLITARSNPALFGKLYPPVAPTHAHLLGNLTGNRTATPVTAPHQMADRHGRRGAVTAPVPAANQAAAPVLTPRQMTALTVTLRDTYKMSNERAGDVAYAFAMGHPAELPAGFNIATITG